MSSNISEKRFEDAVEEVLTAKVERDTAGASGVSEYRTKYRGWLPGGYKKREYSEYDRSLCLIPRDVIDFIYATQPEE